LIEDTMKTITREELWTMTQSNQNVTIIEALSQEEYDKGHIAGAIRMTKGEVEALAPKLLPNKNATIVVYCANLDCTASPTVAGMLLSRGYKNVYDYEGGKADWIAAGLPVVTATKV
jgi:rhodanese-related sulfurtransferase